MGMHEHQSYEVQVHHNGRWQVHARYPHHERALAIREAKDMNVERSGNIMVRVILEDYNPRTGRHNETMIYRNRAEPPAKKVARRVRYNDWDDPRGGYFSDDDFYFSDDLPATPKASVSSIMFLGILLSILAISIGAGGAATGLLYLLMKGFGMAMEPVTQRVVMTGMFCIVFIIAATSTYSHYAARFDLNPFKKKKKTTRPVKPSKVSQEMKKAAADIDKISKTETPPTEIPAEDENFAFVEEAKEADQQDDQAAEDENSKVDFSEEAQHQKMFLINFLGTCLGALKGPEGSADKINRFAVNMFMTGATLRICADNDLSDSETAHILRRMLEMLGAKPDQISRFLREYPKHLEQPRHKGLFEQGGDIAARFSDGDQSAPLYIRASMEEWGSWRPSPDADANPNLLTIMFTDMVGSTDLATRHGDYAAQEVLKSHDLIVRTALTNFEGNEIKHLGDGIMASFKDHSKAVACAIEIQKRIEGNNNAGPEFPLHVRIGLHSGQPIKKQNDLFGTAVQLSARLCAFCPSNSICISQDLKDLFGEKPTFTFTDLGGQKMKGFDKLITVFEVDWKAMPIEYSDGTTPVSPIVEQDHTAPDMAVVAHSHNVEKDAGFDAGLPIQKPEHPAAKPTPEDVTEPSAENPEKTSPPEQ